MGLEAPLVLLGLLAAALPVLIHRMRKRELPRLVLPTFALLARAAAKSQQRRALSDLLLLALRIAIIAFACLSLATPYVTARVSLGDGQLGSVVFVIDDSLSMARDDGNGNLITQARTRALDALSTLPVGSEVAIVLGGKPARVISPLSRDLGAAKRALAAPLPALRRGDLERAVQLGLQQLNAAGWPHRSLFVLSDFARGAALDPSTLQAAGVRVAVERMGKPPTRCNLFLEQLHAAADPAEPDKTSISVAVGSACAPGARAPAEARLEVLGRGKTLAKSDLALQNGHAKALLSVDTPDPDADPGARIRLITDDALAADNEAGVVLARADAVRVLMVNGDPRPASREDELYYALRALTLVPEAWLALSVRSVDPLAVERSQLRDADVVVLANVPAPEPAFAQELQRFVESGGGLIVTGGHRVDAQRYNAVLGSVLATHIIGTGQSADVKFADEVDANYLPDGILGLREVQTRGRLLLERGAEAPISFADGLPALVTRSVGEGRSLLWASTIDADWSDLPYRPGFLPLLAAMLRDAAGPAAVARTPLVPGDEVALPWPRLGSELEIQRPDGKTQRFAVDLKQRTLRYRDTEAIGVFSVRAISDSGTTRRGAFVVNPPEDEADVSPGPLPKPEAASGRLAPVSVHKPLDAPLLWLVLALALAEGALRGRRKT
jgi:hypothetical protein